MPQKCIFLHCCRDAYQPTNYTPQPEDKPFCIFHSPLIEQKRADFYIVWNQFLAQHKNENGEYQELDCSGFVFPEHIDFSGARFSGDARFDEASFSGEAWFDGARFSGYASFYNASFSGYAIFYNARFSGAAWFIGARFSGDAGFNFARFSGAAVFAGAKFNSGVHFYCTRWQAPADFLGMELKGASVDFIGGRYPAEDGQEQETRLFEGDKKISFDQVNFLEAKVVRFEHVDLSRASFLRSQIERVDFLDVWWEKEGKGHKIYNEREWREKGEGPSGSAEIIPGREGQGKEGEGAQFSGHGLLSRVCGSERWSRVKGWFPRGFKALQEEIGFWSRKDKAELAEVEHLYHQLILNFDRRRDYESGGEFYVREVESRRIRKGWRGYLLEGVYWLTSKYGQSIFRPLGWLVLGLIFFLRCLPRSRRAGIGVGS